MLKHAKKIIKNLLNRYLIWINKDEFAQQKFTRFNERPIELGFIFNKLRDLYPHSILDVGTGTTALPQLMRDCGCLVTATDNIRDYWPTGMLNRHYHVLDDDIQDTHITEKFDLITCISVLEHIQNPDAAMRNLLSLLNPGGHLLLSFPYNEKSYVRNVYDLPGSSYGKGLSYITQAFSRNELDKWLLENNAALVDQEYWQCWEGEHWTVGAQIIPPQRVTADDMHQLSCLLIQKP